MHNAQIISQEMSVAPNPLLLNGKVLLTQRQSDGNNQTMYQICKYGVPFSFLPHLNSLPEKTASTGMSEAICSTSSSITLDKNKVTQDHLPREVIDIVGRSYTNGNIQGMERQPITDELAGLSISKPVISPQVVSFQQQECKKSTVMPSEGAVLHESDNEECRHRENQVIDLNKTPQKKPRRKKHRPKVMKEGKPARATKPATPNPLTPKRARNKESPGNRKYVRKKKLNSLDTPSCPLEENVRQGIESDIASVRRCLNFDSEYQAKVGCPKPSFIFAHNTKVQAQDASIPSTITSLSTKPTISSVQRQQEVLENVKAQFTFDVNSSTTQLPNEFVSIPQSPTSPSQSSRRETTGLNHMPNEYIRVQNDSPPPVQPSGREIMSENLKDSPKVIKEGKSARILKPAKPKPVTPKPARNKESTSGKRKYTRENKLNSLSTPLCPRGESIGQGNGTGIASVRQCLNFDSDNSQTKDRCHRSPVVFACNTEVPVQDAEIPSTIVSSSSKSAIPSVLGKEAEVENPPAEVPFDLNRSTSQLHKEFRRVSKTKISPSRPSRRETLSITHMLNGYIGVENKSLLPMQLSRRELIRENLKILAWRNTYLMIADNSHVPPETGQKKQPESNNTRDLPLGRMKGAHDAGEECVSMHRNFMHDCNNINHNSESLDRSRDVSHFLGSRKRKRTENRKKKVKSNVFSSVRSAKATPVMPNCCEAFSLSDAQRPVLSSSRMILTVPNNNGTFTSTDGQRLIDLEKQQAVEHMLSSDQRDMKTMKVSKAVVQANILSSFSAARGYNNLTNPLKPSKFDNTGCRQLSILRKLYECNHIQASESCGPQVCTEVLAVNDHVKSQMKRSTEKQIHFVKPMSSNTNEVLKEDKIASHSSDSSHRKKSLQVITSASQDFQDKNSNFHVSSFPDYQNSSNSKESSSRLYLSSAPHGNPVDDIVRKLECLDINGGHDIVTTESENVLVPYDSGSGLMVTYDGPFDLTKKHHPRAKVDIDPETNRVWNVLMGKKSSDEKIDTDKDKWWEEERRIFCGRVDSFIARMHLIQGNRRFSQWKGSVVDSVVGVFLTQNVSDHLSSSAFMALAARFPLRSKSNEAYIKPNAEKVRSPEQQERCTVDLDESINFEESRSGHVLCNRGSLLNVEAEHVAEEEMPYNNESLGSNMGGSILGYSRGKSFDKSPRRSSGTPVIVRGSSQVPEAEDRRSIEDVVSSQNSAVSSQNSSECLVQTADQIPMSSLLNFYADDLVYDSMCDGLDSSTSFLELLHMAETTEFGELYNNDNKRLSSTKSCAVIDQLSCLEVDKRTSGSDYFRNHKGERSSMYTLNSQPNDIPQYLTSVSCAPSSSSDPSSSLNSRLLTIRDKNAERVDSRTYWFPTTLGMSTTNKIDIMDKSYDPLAEYSIEARGQHDFMGMSCEPPLFHYLDNSSSSRLLAMGDVNAARNENIHNLSLNGSGMNSQSNKKILHRRCSLSPENLTESMCQHDFTGVSCSPFPYSQFANGDANAAREASSSLLPSTDPGMNGTNNIKIGGGRFSPSGKNSTEATPRRASVFGLYPEISKHSMQSVTFSEPKVYVEKHSMCPSNLTTEKAEGSLGRNTPSKCSHLQEDQTVKIQQKGRPVESQVRSIERTRAQIQSGRTLQRSLNSLDNLKETSEVANTPDKCSHLQDEQTTKIQQKVQGVEYQVKSTEHSVRAQAKIQRCRTLKRSLNSTSNSSETFEVGKTAEPILITESGTANRASKANRAPNSSKIVTSGTENSASSSSKKVLSGTTNSASKSQLEADKKKTYDWDKLRKQACGSSARKERSSNTMDSLDWEAVRCVDVNELSQIIRDRGMNNMLAQRIKEFLDRVVKDHGSIDLEWLRDVPPDTTKEYLLSIRGLGLKSAECVRLLTLQHVAFPVDTNVGRICVRLGWVPLQPLPESLQLHLLEMYPMLETIQKYIWPRLCKLDQRTLYELHYQMITFGKVFCTKSKPNCNACPMRGECKHFASAFASARLALPGPEEKVLVSSTVPIAPETSLNSVGSLMPFPELKGSTFPQGLVHNNSDPIIEEPATPEPELTETLESEIEDAFYEDPDEIPFIKLNLEKFTQNIQNYVKENNMELQDGDLSKALVAITPEAASIPMPKLKNVSRLRTEHQVYELPDSHPLLEGLDRREPDDPCFYLLAIWSPGETAQSIEVPKSCCNSQDTGKLCDRKTCFCCNSIREAQVLTVRGTLLIPCRTAMRGSFPLNGTYFQVNEVFADHDSSCNPISIPREWIWNLPRRTVYFGTSIPTIFKGLTTEGIQHCFWRGFVCVRGFDRTTRAPKPLYARLHFPASKVARNRKAAAAAAKEGE